MKWERDDDENEEEKDDGTVCCGLTRQHIQALMYWMIITDLGVKLFNLDVLTCSHIDDVAGPNPC